MGDIPFVVIVDSESNLDTLNYTAEFGAKPDSAIPKNLDDEGNAFQKDDFVFDIYISESSDKGQMRKICKKIHDSLTEENYYRAYIVVLNDEDFNALYTAEDKYLEERTHYYNGKKLYKESRHAEDIHAESASARAGSVYARQRNRNDSIYGLYRHEIQCINIPAVVRLGRCSGCGPVCGDPAGAGGKPAGIYSDFCTAGNPRTGTDRCHDF